MRDRIGLHNKLCELIHSDHVYYNPPENLKLYYPCIVYGRGKTNQDRANNRIYKQYASYTATYISKDADSGIIELMTNNIPFCTHDRSFKTDGLFHETFSIFY